MTRAIFLDRDGVINRKAQEGEYVTTWAEVEFLPGALEAIGALSRHGFMIIVITNQRGIATGRIRPESLEEIHTRLKDAVALHGGCIDDIYYCPHDFSEGCDCRKPKPGMLLRAAGDHQLCLANSWMIGDAVSDVTAGTVAGCKTALITHGSPVWPPDVNGPAIQVESLDQAADYIIRQDLQSTLEHS